MKDHTEQYDATVDRPEATVYHCHFCAAKDKRIAELEALLEARHKSAVESRPIGHDDTICPCCGSEDTEIGHAQWDYTPPFGNTVKYPHRFLRCNTCTERISWNTEEDDAIGEKIRLDADKATVGPMLDYLNSIDFFSDPGICITLGLKVGTTKEWRKGNITPAEIHLLRLLRTFTWLLLIPGKDLDSDYVKHLRTASIAFVIEEERKWHENEIRKWRENNTVTVQDSTKDQETK